MSSATIFTFLYSVLDGFSQVSQKMLEFLSANFWDSIGLSWLQSWVPQELADLINFDLTMGGMLFGVGLIGILTYAAVMFFIP